MTRIPGTLGLTPQQVDGLLATAGRAPSPPDGRPWRFHVTSRVIEMYAVAGRAPSAADPDGREQRMACGTALLNLRLALHGHHIRPIVTLLPDRDRPDLLAVVRNGGTKEPTAEQLRLLLVVPGQRTDRRPIGMEVVAPSEQHALRRAALEEGAWLHVVQDRGGRPPAPGATAAEESLLALLTSHLSGTSAEVQVGQALQRVLLTATAAGLAASLLSQLLEVPQTREELRRLSGGARPPQAVLRIGWPGP